jgi:hypothetical protein
MREAGHGSIQPQSGRSPSAMAAEARGGIHGPEHQHGQEHEHARSQGL